MLRFVVFLLVLFVLLPASVFAQDSTTQADPQSALWRSMKSALLGPNGKDYFETSIKDALVPGGVNGLKVFTGTVVSSKPTDYPSEIVLSMSDGGAPEVTLKFVVPSQGQYEDAHLNRSV
jgi:hypothetical protein